MSGNGTNRRYWRRQRLQEVEKEAAQACNDVPTNTAWLAGLSRIVGCEMVSLELPSAGQLLTAVIFLLTLICNFFSVLFQSLQKRF
jgi:hypothetical protein